MVIKYILPYNTLFCHILIYVENTMCLQTRKIWGIEKRLGILSSQEKLKEKGRNFLNNLGKSSLL